jgi:hypothetical protein
MLKRKEDDMRDHIRLLGALYIALGVLGLLGALVALVIFGGVAGLIGTAGADDPGAGVVASLIGLFGSLLFLLLVVLSIPDIVAGLGLLSFRPWARVLALVLSALNLLHLPFGTALGVYGLWVLMSERSNALFEEGRRA